MATVAKAVVEGAKIFELCEIGDNFIRAEVAKVYKDDKTDKGKPILKGIAFPTSINVNNVICHYSPLRSDENGHVPLKKGDVVKVELGTQIDGFPAMAATTVVVGASKENPVTGKKADVILAAYHASEAAVRLFRPGKFTKDITDTVQKIAVEEFNVIPVQGFLSSELRRTTLDGDKQIIINPSEQQKTGRKKEEFALGEFYSMDVLITTSPTGKSRPSNLKTTIYKRNADVMYELKMQTSRRLCSEVGQKFGYFPFHLKHTADEKKARMGVVECVKHDLFMPYDVLEDKPTEVVAQFLVTVLLMPDGEIKKLTSYPFDISCYKSEHSIKNEEIKSLLKEPLKK